MGHSRGASYPWRTATVAVATLMAAALGGLLAGATRVQAATGPALAVDAAASRHPISPDIYGMNFAFDRRNLADSDAQLAADAAFGAEVRVPLDRWGGNNTTRYNFQTQFWNTDNDFFFE